MKSVFWIIWLVLASLIVLFLILYSPRIVAYFGGFKKRARLHNEKHNQIAVLVPARDESATISSLLSSLKRQDYEEFDVFVIVKNPKDPTIKMVEDAGFTCFVDVEQHAKSDALDFALSRILRKNRNKYDAYLILDADTGIKDDYLYQMNEAMASKRDVIVSKKIVKNYFMGKGSLSLQGACNGYIWSFFDDMGNAYRSDHNIALFTVGSGLLLSKRIILANNGWAYKDTITEDCELFGDMIANHWTSYYAAYAPIYMEEAPTLSMTNKRRTRWMTGLTDSQKLYQNKAFGMGSFWDLYFDYSIYLVYLYFGVLGSSVLFHLVSAVVLFFMGSGELTLALYGLLGSLGVIYLSFFFPSFIAFLLSFKDIKGHFFFRLAVCFLVPLHYLGYYSIMGKVFLGVSSHSWDSISRVKENKNV
ncbi:MAG: glycosyltransferase [Bacilli bacterium]|jgi:cellulose synthase/poly-beta-1,6-N-acetylglucosamine synthase-like glycosyltransferase|nr:glycosyltransferase [Bacilli bacterium]MCH4211073.1 glycosyltransferase [Bacilli bacterium]